VRRTGSRALHLRWAGTGALRPRAHAMLIRCAAARVFLLAATRFLFLAATRLFLAAAGLFVSAAPVLFLAAAALFFRLGKRLPWPEQGDPAQRQSDILTETTT